LEGAFSTAALERMGARRRKAAVLATLKPAR